MDEDTELTGNGSNTQSKRSTKQRKKSGKKSAGKKKSFQKGKCNPDIILLNTEEERESLKDTLLTTCCSECSNRNLIRAILTNNMTLMKMCKQSRKELTTFYDTWSADIHLNAFYYAVITNNIQMIEELLSKVPHVEFAGKMNYLINYADTGNVSYQAFGTKVRKVQLGRGNRQGNNAFLEKSYNTTMNENVYLKMFLESQKVESTTIDKLLSLKIYNESTLYYNIEHAIISGNRKLAIYLLEKTRVIGYSQFNDLHIDVLSLNEEELKEFERHKMFDKVTNAGINAIHCACINPNKKYIEALYNYDNNIHIADANNRKPIHYASACESSEPLKFLLEHGANGLDLDKQRSTPLHYAAKYGRHGNVRVLIDKVPSLLKLKDRDKMLAFHYACIGGHIEAVKAFIEKGVRINIPSGNDRMHGLSYAAAYNQYEICEYLIENKARVLSKDKYKRSALIMAVRNGNSKIVNLLLRKGALWNDSDSSGNTALHYAAAYGWKECAEQLIKAGADTNASNNWKITPLNIAMLKNHYGMIKFLLDQPKADVNCKDEEGRTLVHVALDFNTDGSFDYIKFLLEEKKADPNIANVHGITPLLYLVQK